MQLKAQKNYMYGSKYI